MEKLIELIISFMKEIGKTTYDISKYIYDDELKLIVIAENGKSFIDSIDIYRLLFGSDFIKWLVKNDKINLLQLDNRIALSEFNKAERVLMALSISNSPIEDLISYLNGINEGDKRTLG